MNIVKSIRALNVSVILSMDNGKNVSIKKLLSVFQGKNYKKKIKTILNGRVQRKRRRVITRPTVVIADTVEPPPLNTTTIPIQVFSWYDTAIVKYIHNLRRYVTENNPDIDFFDVDKIVYYYWVSKNDIEKIDELFEYEDDCCPKIRKYKKEYHYAHYSIFKNTGIYVSQVVEHLDYFWSLFKGTLKRQFITQYDNCFDIEKDYTDALIVPERPGDWKQSFREMHFRKYSQMYPTENKSSIEKMIVRARTNLSCREVYNYKIMSYYAELCYERDMRDYFN